MSTAIDPIFGPAWQGSGSYRKFAESVKSDLRYVRSVSANQFLDEVRVSCVHREQLIPQGRELWRARLGCESTEVEEIDDDITVMIERDMPFGAKEMKPIPNWQGEGRAHPRGIPCLYMASTRDTALAEVRPWLGALISVSRLKINRDLKVILCSVEHKKGSFLKLFDPSLSRVDGIWIAIDQAFATPVSKEDETREYIPTQIVAELFKSAGYDGLVYKSLLSVDGFNFALFDLSVADVIDSALFSANGMKYDFQYSGTHTTFGPR
jgi:hypothetical protein